MKFRELISVVSLAVVAACATTSIQPMSQDSFKVATSAWSACKPEGARDVAFQTAAVEVIRRGADKFILLGDANSSDFWSGTHDQSMIVRIIPEDSPEARNALSARDQLGAAWQEIYAKGTPETCM